MRPAGRGGRIVLLLLWLKSALMLIVMLMSMSTARTRRSRGAVVDRLSTRIPNPQLRLIVPKFYPLYSSALGDLEVSWMVLMLLLMILLHHPDSPGGGKSGDFSLHHFSHSYRPSSSTLISSQSTNQSPETPPCGSIPPTLEPNLPTCYLTNAFLRPQHNTQFRMTPLGTPITRELAIAFDFALAAWITGFQFAGFAFFLQELIDEGTVVEGRGAIAGCHCWGRKRAGFWWRC